MTTNTSSSRCCHHVSSRATDTHARCVDRVWRQHHALLLAQQVHRHKPQQGLTGPACCCWYWRIVVSLGDANEAEVAEEDADAACVVEADDPEDEDGGVARMALPE